MKANEWASANRQSDVSGLVCHLRRWHVPEDHIDDAVQQYWLEVCKATLPSDVADDAVRLTRWRKRIASRVSFAALRAIARRHSCSLETIMETGREPIAATGPPDDDLSRDELVVQVHVAIDALCDGPRAENVLLYLQRHVEGRSVTELAAETGLTPAVVSARLLRVKRIIREELLRRGIGES